MGTEGETIVHIQNLNPDDPNSNRELWILPRNGINERFVFAFRNGVLVEIDPKKEMENELGALVTPWILEHYQPGQKFTAEELRSGLNKSGIPLSQATLYRILGELKDAGVVLSPQKGIFQRNGVPMAA